MPHPHASLVPRLLCLGLLIVPLLPGCTTLRLDEDVTDYGEAVVQLQRRLARDSEDTEALRDLGVIYLRTSRYPQATTYLEQALALDPEDPKTLFHLGLANEAVDKRETALRLYAEYPDVPRLSPYRTLMAGRHERLTQILAEETIREAIRQESLVEAQTASRLVAVFPLAYQGQDERYAPLGYGLHAMIVQDLEKVSALQLVERARLQAIEKELQLGQSAYVDPATAPRAGRLLGAGRIVGGVYDILGGDELRLDAALVETETSTGGLIGSQSGGLDNLLRVQKRLVFDLLDRMGITLTPEERGRIEEVPTQNLQAFLAYSRGLEREYAGAYSEAAVHFREAAALDPTFEAATTRAETAEGRTVAGGTVGEGLAAAEQVDPSATLETVPINPLTIQVQVLNGNLGEGVLPEPAADAPTPASTGLPLPPGPPGSGGN